MGRVVLVTGIASSFASQFAVLLAAQKGVDKVVGIDTTVPTGQLDGVKFVRADIRTPVVGKVIAVEEVDTVVHLGVSPTTRGRSGAAKELNVIGTMQLLAACQRAAGVKKLVLNSSTAVYGTSSRDPAMFTESLLARDGVRTGFPKDIVEVESYVRGCARRRPEVLITILRGAQLLHPDFETPLRGYFDNPVLPTAMGYDPRLQFLHLDDAMNVLTQSVVHDRPGTFNVAGDGIVMLSQAARRLGKPVIPLPPFGFAAGARRVLKAMGSDMSPDLHRLLMYGRVVDTSALRDIFGYELKWTSEQAFEEYRSTARPGIMSSLGGRS